MEYGLTEQLLQLPADGSLVFGIAGEQVDLAAAEVRNERLHDVETGVVVRNRSGERR